MVISSDHDDFGLDPILETNIHKGLRAHPFYSFIKRKCEKVIDAHVRDHTAALCIRGDQVILGFTGRRILKSLHGSTDIKLLCFLEHSREDLLVT